MDQNSGLLQNFNIHFFHLHKSFGHPAGPHRIAHQLRQNGRYDLPRDAVTVLEPSAGSLFPAFAQPKPLTIDLFLRVAENLKRDRFAELEDLSAVQGSEGLSVQTKLHGHHRNLFLAVNFKSLFGKMADHFGLFAVFFTTTKDRIFITRNECEPNCPHCQGARVRALYPVSICVGWL